MEGLEQNVALALEYFVIVIQIPTLLTETVTGAGVEVWLDLDGVFGTEWHQRVPPHVVCPVRNDGGQGHEKALGLVGQ